MTLTSTVTKVSYSGDGSTTSFAITFIFWDDTDIKAISTVDATGVETTWVKGTQYTLSGGSGATGTLTVVTSPTDYTPASGETLTIKSNRSNTQDISFPIGGDFPSASAEEANDKNVRLVQQRTEEIDRTPKFAESSSTSGITVPEPAADELIGWNAGGTDMANITLGSVTADFDSILTSEASGDMLRYDGTNWRNRTAAQTRSDLGVPQLTGNNTFSGTNAFTGTNTHTKTVSWNKGADIASASSITFGTDGNYFDLTGTTGVSTVNGVAGTTYWLQTDGVVTFTHHATNLDLPGEANFTSAAGDVLQFFMTGAATAQVVNITKADGKAVVSKTVNMVTVKDTGALTTTTTTIARDDSVPQNTEGVEHITVSITPQSSTNKLHIIARMMGSISNATDSIVMALFQDSTAGALEATTNFPKVADVAQTMQLVRVQDAGTTSSTTFKIRIGNSGAGTVSINGEAGGRLFAGVSHTTLTVLEVEP